MEFLKRQILLEPGIYRGSGTTITSCDTNVIQAERGELKNCDFYLPIFITQTFDDIGLYTDVTYDPIQPLTNPPTDLMNLGRLPGLTEDMFYTDTPVVVTGETDDKWLLEVISPQDTYIPGVNQCSRDCKDASGNWVRFDGVTSYNPSTQVIKYVVGGDADPISGALIPNTGINYTTYSGQTISNIDPVTGDDNSYSRTTFSFTSSGRNAYNTSLSAITKEEEFLGVVFPQEVQSEVFIERGGEDIFEKHMILAEIKTVDDIRDYRNGYLLNRE
jgi:hypothetical protein